MMCLSSIWIMIGGSWSIIITGSSGMIGIVYSTGGAMTTGGGMTTVIVSSDTRIGGNMHIN